MTQKYCTSADETSEVQRGQLEKERSKSVPGLRCKGITYSTVIKTGDGMSELLTYKRWHTQKRALLKSILKKKKGKKKREGKMIQGLFHHTSFLLAEVALSVIHSLMTIPL